MYNIDKKQFGAFVARLRKEKGFTQKDLASRLFVSDKAVSKWETGVSLPDTALLMPLAESLGVTVTELLLCRRNAGKNLTPADAEKAVQTAIGYSVPAGRVWQRDKRAAIGYVIAVLCAAAAITVAFRTKQLNSTLLTYVGLTAFFGAYFCMFAQRRLPDIYDQAPISFMSDGPVRMNLPGVHFNNRNWPHILRTAQISSAVLLALFPWFYLALHLFTVPWLSATTMHWISLAVVLGGLLLPLIVAGHTYE